VVHSFGFSFALDYLVTRDDYYVFLADFKQTYSPVQNESETIATARDHLEQALFYHRVSCANRWSRMHALNENLRAQTSQMLDVFDISERTRERTAARDCLDCLSFTALP
jgi:hypothetical protein